MSSLNGAYEGYDWYSLVQLLVEQLEAYSGKVLTASSKQVSSAAAVLLKRLLTNPSVTVKVGLAN